MDKSYWNKRAKREGKLAVGHHRWDLKTYMDQTLREQRLLLPVLPAPISINKLIDFGCGSGRMAAWLAGLFSEKAYIGIDFSEEMIKLAKRITPIFSFVLIDKAFPFANESIDLVFSCTVLQHIVNEDRLKLVTNEISRVLKTKAPIILFENTAERTLPSSYIKFRSPETYCQIFGDSGIKLYEVTGATFEGELHTIFAGVKS